MQAIDFRFECHELLACVFIFPECGDRVHDFFRIDLGGKVDPDDDHIAIKSQVRLLVEHKDQASGIGTNLVFRDIGAIDDRNALEIGSDLFQGISLCRLSGQSHGIFSGVAVAHAIFPLRGDLADLGKGHGERVERDNDEERD